MTSISDNQEADRLAVLNKQALFLLYFFSITMFLFALYCGIEHDYKVYLKQWASLVGGGDPYAEGNFYGPLHNLIGYGVLIHPLAPKALISGSLLFAHAFIAYALVRARPLSPLLAVYLLTIPLNGLFLGIGIVYGLNDAIVAAILTSAVFLRLNHKYIATSIAVVIAALFKFYPILLLPFFFIEDRKIRLMPIIVGACLFILGLVLSYFIWGPGLLQSFVVGATRGVKQLSILRDLSLAYGDDETLALLIKYNSLCVIGSALLSLAYSYSARLSWLEAAVLGYFNILVTYKVGHQQFYLPLLFMIACLPLMKQSSADRMMVNFIPLILYISFYHVAFDVGHIFTGRPPRWIDRGGAGFVMFGLAIFINVTMIFDRWWQARRLSKTTRVDRFGYQRS